MLKFLLMLTLLSSCQSAHKINLNNWPKPEKSIVLKSQDIAFSLKDLNQTSKASVFIFWQIGCPCVKRYQERVRELFKTYSPKGVSFFYVSSNQNETFLDAQKEYQSRKEPLMLLRDEGGHFAKALNVKGTPSVAVFNKEGEVIYLGWMDNERKPGENGRFPYLENALDEYLNGQPVSVKTSPMFGCPIR